VVGVQSSCVFGGDVYWEYFAGAGEGGGWDGGLGVNDPLFLRGKADIVQMIEIMQQMSDGEEHGSAVAKTRAAVLSQYL